jgi:hypothetical protein
MANVVSTFQLTITAVDINNQQPVTRTYTVKLTNGNTGEFSLYQNIAVALADYVVQLPGTPLQAIAVKNNSATAKLTVKWTPNGGAAVTVVVIGPGGMVSYIDPTAAGAGIGITNLTLNTDTAGTPVEIYMGV